MLISKLLSFPNYFLHDKYQLNIVLQNMYPNIRYVDQRLLTDDSDEYINPKTFFSCWIFPTSDLARPLPPLSSDFIGFGLTPPPPKKSDVVCGWSLRVAVSREEKWYPTILRVICLQTAILRDMKMGGDGRGRRIRIVTIYKALVQSDERGS